MPTDPMQSGVNRIRPRTLGGDTPDRRGTPAPIAVGDPAHTPIRSLALGWHGDVLAVGLQGGTVKVIEVASGKVLRTLTGNREDVPFLRVHPSVAVAGAGDMDLGPSINLWDYRWEKTSVRDLRLKPADMRFTGAACLEQLIGREVPEIRPGEQSRPTLLVCAPDARTFATVDHYRDPAGGPRRPEVNLWGKEGNWLATLRGQGAVIQAVAWSYDGTTLATAGLEKVGPAGARGTVMIWDLASLKPGAKFTGLKGDVFQVQFSRDGKTVVSCSTDDGALFWDVEEGKVIARFPELGPACATAVALSPDGLTLAMADSGNTIRVWDVTAVVGRWPGAAGGKAR